MSICTQTCSESLTKTIHESLRSNPVKGILQGERKLTKGRSGKRIVFFPSKKNNALMPCESRLEADNCLDLEFDRDVSFYRTQPFTIDLGNNETYTPDSIHQNKLGTIIIREVKFSGTLSNETLVKRLQKIENILSIEGFQFEILTEKTLQLPPRINNYQLLYKCSHQKYDSMVLDFAIDILNKLPTPCSLRELRNQCNRSHLPALIADSLLFLNIARYDENKLLSADSLIWKKGSLS